MTIIETSSRKPVTLGYQPEEAPAQKERDGAQVDAGALSLYDLEKFLNDIRDEPEWRTMANRCADYYDHNQLTDEVLAAFRDAGLPPFVINLIHPTINTVLGMEAKTRTDWKVDWEDQANEQVALAIGKKMTEAERLSYADRAISDAYAGQVKAGLGWVEIGINPNPFGYRYRARSVHRREIWWDWRKREVEDWRYLVRRQRFDADQLLAVPAFKPYKEMIAAACEGGLTWQEFANRMDDSTGLGQFFDIERALTIEGQEWIDCIRKQMSVFEVWYQRFVTGYVARVGDTTIEVDTENPRHMLAIAYGKMKPVMATFPKLRQAIFIGPQRVIDRPSPLPHRKIPYVPFFGYREDLTGAPYGLIRGMISSQDDINNRRSKMRAMMNSRRVEMDSDALDTTYNTLQDVADEASRHDAFIVLNPSRKNGANGFKITDNADLSQGQAQVLESAKNEIHETSGVFPPMAGDNKGRLSGIAINSLVEQGTQTLAEINDNYSWARRECGDQMMELVKADSLHEHDVVVGEGKNQRPITLNKRKADPLTLDGFTGEVIEENNVAAARLRLVLEDVPSTPAWRQQQSQSLAEITKSLPPQLQAFMVPFYMEATDIPQRKKIAAILRKQLNIPDEGPDGEPQQDPQVQQLTQQLQEVQAQGQQAVSDLSQKLQTALLQLKDQSEKNEIARQKVDDDHEAKERELDIKETVALATAVQKEFPKGGAPGADEAAGEANAIIVQLMEALEENTATMREGFREMHGRIQKLERPVDDEAVEGETSPAPATDSRARKPGSAKPPAVNVTVNNHGTPI